MEEKKGFFKRLAQGLSKTRDNIASSFDSIFSGFSGIDEDFYEELEEILIMSDMGIDTTMNIIEELVSVLDNLTDKKKEASKEKSKTYKAKERFKDIFDKAEQIRGLDDAESCYQSGDTFFEDEHNAWERLNTELLAQGYSVEEVESLRKKYESKYAQDCKAERAVSKELNLGRSIWKELTVSASAEEKQYDKETIRDRKEQPVR